MSVYIEMGVTVGMGVTLVTGVTLVMGVTLVAGVDVPRPADPLNQKSSAFFVFIFFIFCVFSSDTGLRPRKQRRNEKKRCRQKYAGVV